MGVNKGLLIDLDGVLYQGAEVVPGSVEAIKWVQQQSIPHVFITNTTSRPRQQIVEKLDRMGFTVTADEILTPPVAACQWLKKNVSGPTVLFVPDTTREDFSSIPLLENQEGPVAAVVLGDLAHEWTFTTLNRAFLFLMQEARPALIALGITRYWRTDQGLQLDVGPFVKALEYAASCRAVVLGKPSANFFVAALQILRCDPSLSVMIGDDIVGDIHGAQQAGLKGVLVRTGKFRSSDLKGEIRPDAVINSIADLPVWWEQ